MIPYFHKYEGDFEYGQRIDQQKMESAIELGYAFLEIMYDEPYTDLRHLRTRLRDLQVEIVQGVGKNLPKRSRVEGDEEIDFEDLGLNQ